MEHLFDLLKMKPVLSIVLGFVLAIFTMIFFKDLIIAYIKKKFNLYSEEEVRKAFREYYNENIRSEIFEDDSSESEEIVLRILKNKRIN